MENIRCAEIPASYTILHAALTSADMSLAKIIIFFKIEICELLLCMYLQLHAAATIDM